MINVASLKPYVPSANGLMPWPSTVKYDVNGNPEFEVDKIIDEKNDGIYAIEYQVYWKGYGMNEDTWEYMANLLLNAESILQK